jgi:fatty acyl-CoA reductase
MQWNKSEYSIHISVTSVAQEPLVAWINNVNGAVGMVLVCGLGLIRSIYCSSDIVADIVPVDMAVNAAIAVAWDVAQSW